jgi:FkbM family methyltransferase
MDIKTPLKRLRENPIAGTLIRSPFRLLRAFGFPLPNSIYKHLPFHGAFVLHHPDGVDFGMISYGYELENNLYWEGLSGWEPECIRPWIRFASEARVVLDIGANTGLFSLLAAATKARPTVHAFEPVSRIATILETNCSLNPGLSIVVHETAVGAWNGEVELFDPGGACCYSASLDPRFLELPTSVYRVRQVSLDAEMDRGTIRDVDLIKLDVEGWEEWVLDGMHRMIDSFKPTVMVELLSPGRTHLVERISRLVETGYQLYQMSAAGLKLSSRIEPFPGTRNVVLHHLQRRMPAELLETASREAS